MILLNSFPKVSEHFVDTLKHGRQIMKLIKVLAANATKHVERRTDKTLNDGKCLTVKGRSKKRS